MKKYLLLLLAFLPAIASAAFTPSQLSTTTAVNGYVLQSLNGKYNQWVATSSLGITGGSGTPGGSNKEIQYNNSSAFGGNSLFTINTSNKNLQIGSTTFWATGIQSGSSGARAGYITIGSSTPMVPTSYLDLSMNNYHQLIARIRSGEGDHDFGIGFDAATGNNGETRHDNVLCIGYNIGDACTNKPDPSEHQFGEFIESRYKTNGGATQLENYYQYISATTSRSYRPFSQTVDLNTDGVITRFNTNAIYINGTSTDTGGLKFTDLGSNAVGSDGISMSLQGDSYITGQKVIPGDNPLLFRSSSGRGLLYESTTTGNSVRNVSIIYPLLEGLGSGDGAQVNFFGSGDNPGDTSQPINYVISVGNSKSAGTSKAIKWDGTTQKWEFEDSGGTFRAFSYYPGTSTSPSMATYFVATSTTATSTFSAGLEATNINLTSTTATSTAANGINLSGGCFAISGTCISGGGGGGTPGGSNTYLQYNDSGSFNGGSDITYIKTAISTPSAPSVSQGGTGGATSYSYKVVAYNAVGHTAASSAGNTTTGNATLTVTNYNIVTTPAVTGSTYCEVYRTATAGTPTSLGLLGTVSCGSALNDTGLDYAQGSGGPNPPTTNTTQGAAITNLGNTTINGLPMSLAGDSATVQQRISIGPGITNTGILGVTIGTNAVSTGNFSTAVGSIASTEGYAGTCVGYDSNCSADHSVGLGVHTRTPGVYGVAIGGLAEANSTGSVSIGGNSSSDNINALNIGYQSHSTGQYAVNIGNIQTLSGNFSVNIGDANHTTSGTGAIGIGYGTSITTTNSIGLGVFANPATDHTFMVGGPRDDGTFYVNRWLGGQSSSVANPFTIQGADVTGSNVAGSNLTIAGGQSTGNAKGGSVFINSSLAGSSGSSQNATANLAVFTTAGLGIGTTTPGALVNPYGSGNQLLLSYDSSKSTTLTTDSLGGLQITPNTSGQGVYVNTSVNGGLHIGGTYGRLYFDGTDGSVAGVFDRLDGKDVYFGESADTGKFIFRGTGATTFEGAMGVGVASPAYKLEVNGTASTTNLNLPSTASASVGVISFGGTRFLHNYGTNNIFLGLNSGNFTTTNGGQNIGIGRSSLSGMTSGSGNNTALGDFTGDAISTGESNTLLGFQSGRGLSTGSFNVLIGATIAGSYNGDGLVAIGSAAFQNGTAGSQNVAIGQSSLTNSGSTSFNTSIGAFALNGVQTDGENTAVGRYALNVNTGGQNVGVGTQAGITNTSGSHNTLIGSFADVSTTGLTNAGAFGYGAIVSTSNSIVLGNGANIGIGTSSPYAKLSVQSGASTGDAFVVATTTGATIGGYDNDGHRFTAGPAPTISSCGTGTGTVVGDDQSGTITTATAATSCTATFAKAYRAAPVCTVTDDSLTGIADVSSVSTTAVTFGISSALTGGKLYYNCSYHRN